MAVPNTAFKTANTGATTISDLDDGRSGQVVTVIFGDANTTVDFTASGLVGNGGADWSPALNDQMICVYDGTDWYCGVITTGGGGGDVTKVGTPVDNQIGVWTGDGTIEGDANLTWDSSHLLIGVTPGNDPVTPTLAFGDGDTGFYEVIDDLIGISINGGIIWQFSAVMGSANTGQGAIRASTPTGTNPSFVPAQTDLDTGMGWNAADQLSLVAGGVELMRLTEDVGGNTVAMQNYTFDVDQTVGVGQDDFVLTYDNASGLISLEAAGAGIADGTTDGQILIWDQTTDTAWEASTNFTFSESGGGGTGHWYIEYEGASVLHYQATDGGVLYCDKPVFRLDLGNRLDLWPATGSERPYIRGLDTSGPWLHFSAESVASMADTGALFDMPINLAGQLENPTSPGGPALFGKRESGFASALLQTQGSAVAHPVTNYLQLVYGFSTSTTAANPTENRMRLNNASFASVTEIYVADLDYTENDTGWFWGMVSVGDTITLHQDTDTTRWLRCTVDTITDNTGWWTIDVTPQDQAGPGSFNNLSVVNIDWFPISSNINNVVDESADTTCYPLFSTDATGTTAPKTNAAGLKFNSVTGNLDPTLIGGKTPANLLEATDNATITGNWTFDVDNIADLLVHRNGTTLDAMIGYTNDDGVKGYLGFNDAASLIMYDSGGVDVQFEVTSAGVLSTDGDYYPSDQGTNFVSSARIVNWQTAFGWGDHSGLYELADAAIVKSDETETISAAWRFDGQVNIDTNTDTAPLRITRLGSATEQLTIGVNDTEAKFNFNQDETTGLHRIIFDYVHSGAGNATGLHSFRLNYEGLTRHTFFMDAGQTGYYMSGGNLRVYDDGGTDYGGWNHNGTDFNMTFGGTTDWNISGITAINAGTVDADFDALTATSYGGIVEASLVSKTAFEEISNDWEWQDNQEVRFGTGNDSRFSFNGTDLYLEMLDGVDFRLRGGTSGTENMLIAISNAGVHLYYNNVQALATQQAGTAGNTSSVTIEDHASNARDAGFNDQVEIPMTTSNITLDDQHAGAMIRRTGTSTVVLTMASSGTTFPIGSMCTVMNHGTAGSLTISDGSEAMYIMDGSGTTVDSPGFVLAIAGVINIWRQGTSAYYIWGAGIP